MLLDALALLLQPPAARGKSLEERAQDLIHRPATSTLSLVTTSSLIFFAAERGFNPKVNTIWDALVYCTTCLSVGYADIFAMTPVGKIVGSTLMTLGPALSGAALDGPREAKADDHIEREILATLQQILARLPDPKASGDDPPSA